MMSMVKYIGMKVEIIYHAKCGEISQRRIRVKGVFDGIVLAFDLGKHAPRRFEEKRILAHRLVSRNAS